MLNFAFLIVFLFILTKITLLNQVTMPLQVPYVRVQHLHPPTHPPSIYIIQGHFKGSVAHRPPLVHPDCQLELICTPTVPPRGHTAAICVGSEALQVQKPPPPDPCMAKKSRTRCTQIHTMRLSDTHCGGLHISWVH
jgi:hypothetical protein